MASCSYALPLARTLVVHACATAHLPNVVLVGACGPALSTENIPYGTVLNNTKALPYRAVPYRYVTVPYRLQTVRPRNAAERRYGGTTMLGAKRRVEKRCDYVDAARA